MHSELALKNSVWECEREFEGLFLSPFALPRAVRLVRNYHMRERMWSGEFLVAWSFLLIRFEAVTGGNDGQQRRALRSSKGFRGCGCRFRQEGKPGRGFEELCILSLLHPPHVHDMSDDAIPDLWTEVLNAPT